jgi:mannose-6-phosphate isomerase class I
MAGTLICEVQQSSNTTFRLYDWDRLPARALHIEESMAVTNWDTASLPAITHLGPIGSGLVKTPRQQLVRNAFFDVAIHELPANGSRGSADVLSPTGAILNVVGGSGRMMGEGWTVELRLGADVVPAGGDEGASVYPRGRDGTASAGVGEPGAVGARCES